MIGRDAPEGEESGHCEKLARTLQTQDQHDNAVSLGTLLRDQSSEINVLLQAMKKEGTGNRNIL
jgi:hypothetical protein